MSNSESAIDMSLGWTLLQALQQVDPDLFMRWSASKAALDGLPHVMRSRVSVSRISGNIRRRTYRDDETESKRNKLNDEIASLFEQLQGKLWNELKSRRHVAYGSRGGSSAVPTEIYSGGWDDIRVTNWERSTIRERRGERTEFFGVRIFPASGLNSTGGAKDLSSKTLTKKKNQTTKPAGEATVIEASKKLWPKGIPASLRKSEVYQQISGWLKANGRLAVSEKTISRYLPKRRLNS